MAGAQFASATVIAFPRPLAHSHVLILTEREGKRVEPEVITRGSWAHCVGMAGVIALAHHVTGTQYRVLSASEFDALKEGRGR